MAQLQPMFHFSALTRAQLYQVYRARVDRTDGVLAAESYLHSKHHQLHSIDILVLIVTICIVFLTYKLLWS